MLIAIVEDNPVIGRIIKKYIEENNPDMLATLYGSGQEALSGITDANLPAVILMDINLPDISGIEVTREIKNRYPQIEIIMQTVVEDTRQIIDSIEAGASGYILKDYNTGEIINAIHTVLDGGSFLTGKIAKKVLQRFRKKPDEKPGIKFNLTHREEEILQDLVEGLAYKEIAHKHGLRIPTVNQHIRNIYQKMQVSSRAEAVALTRENFDAK